MQSSKSFRIMMLREIDACAGLKGAIQQLSTPQRPIEEVYQEAALSQKH
jgi:hypothetical protein